MKTLSRLLVAAGLVLLATTDHVRASPVWSAPAHPVWSLQWQFGTNALISDSGRSAVFFNPHNTTSSASNISTMVAHVGVLSYMPPWSSDAMTRQNYGMLLKLTDLASHASRYLWFAGSLTGRISQHWTSLTNHFDAPTALSNIRLGRDLYNISIGPFVTPNWNNHFNGAIYAHVSYQPMVTHPRPMDDLAVGSPRILMGNMDNPPLVGNKPPPPVSPTPEPSSLLLGGMALAFGIPVWWRKQRCFQ